jgi:hypothetical protein
MNPVELKDAKGAEIKRGDGGRKEIECQKKASVKRGQWRRGRAHSSSYQASGRTLWKCMGTAEILNPTMSRPLVSCNASGCFQHLVRPSRPSPSRLWPNTCGSATGLPLPSLPLKCLSHGRFLRHRNEPAAALRLGALRISGRSFGRERLQRGAVEISPSGQSLPSLALHEHHDVLAFAAEEPRADGLPLSGAARHAFGFFNDLAEDGEVSGRYEGECGRPKLCVPAREH